MKIHVLTRKKDEITFGHYSQHELDEMRKNGWIFVYQTTLEEWPIPNLKIRKPRNKRQIGVNKHGVPIYK